MAVCVKPGIRSKYRLLALLLALFIAVGFCHAQSDALAQANIDDMSISSIDVDIRGYVTVKKQKILATVRARVGERFDTISATEDARRIGQLEGVQSAYYNTVIENSQVKLTFVVIERNLVKSITFIGNEKFDDKKLLKELGFKRGDYLDRMLVGSGVTAISEQYHKKGFSAVDVTVDNDKLAQGQVVYNIVEGPQTTVKKVLFAGNDSFTAKELLKATKTKPKKYMFWPVYYNVEQIGKDEIELVRAYQKRGYFDSQITSSVEFSDDGKWAFVTFTISEGPIYIVDEIIFTDNEFFSDAELIEGLKLQVGDFYSTERADYDRRKVLGRFLEQGFVEATVRLKDNLLDQGRAKVEFIITEGDQFRIARVNITGNEEVHDKVIRHILDEENFKPGELFNADLARGDGSGELEKLLQRMVYTQSTFIEATGDKPGTRDANVNVEEGKTGQVMLGAGVASDSGLIGQFRYDQRNFDISDVPESWTELIMGKAFKGAGQQLSISASPGTVQSTFSVSFTESYLYDKPISLQTRFSGFERRYESYDEGRLKGYVAFEKRYQSKWRRGFSFRLEEVKVSDIEFDAPKEIKDVRGRNNLAGVRVFVRKDTTGNRFMPYEGYHFNAGYEQVGGDYTFGILDGTHRWYKTLHEDLAERKTILEMKLHAGTIIGSDAPPFEKFYGGGTSSIRGFQYRGVSTRGLQTGPGATGEKKDPIGSDWIVTGSAEVAVPLAADVFSALFFVDAGMIDSGGPRASVGTGLQILLPQWFGPVPMRFELATPVLKEKEDDKQVFSFSVGALF